MRNCVASLAGSLAPAHHTYATLAGAVFTNTKHFHLPLLPGKLLVCELVCVCLRVCGA